MRTTINLRPEYRAYPGDMSRKDAVLRKALRAGRSLDPKLRRKVTEIRAFGR